MLDGGDLSDSERRRLAEIESTLTTEDPAFAHRFAEPRLRRRRKRHNVAALLTITIAVGVVVVGLMGNNVAAAVVGLVGIGATVGIWATMRRPRQK
jgi:Flp pilus assembly protein TadB